MASLGRRALSLLYEALLLTAVVLAGSLPFVALAQDVGPVYFRPLYQVYLVALAGVYFTWQWQRGRTLAMTTWRLRVVTRQGGALTWGHAVARYLFALPGAILAGAGFLWALVDREGLFLHDRLAGTMIIYAPATSSSPRR